MNLNGAPPGSHGLEIHRNGDLSDGWKSTGAAYDFRGSAAHSDCGLHPGSLGSVTVNESGKAQQLLDVPGLHVADIIGRACILSQRADFGAKTNPGHNGFVGEGLAWGIIARSAGLQQNSKRVCLCSGRTIWEESKL